RLQGHGPALALPLTWIEQRLAEESLTIEQMVQSENQQQAVDQVSISNSIGSLRFLGAYDWRVFVESMSIVEQILREDKNNIYTTMDFATRDDYRRVVDRLAKFSKLAEAEVAQAAIDLARAASALAPRGNGVTENDGSAGRVAHQEHVGYYLVDDGLAQLEKNVGARLPRFTRVR